MWVGDVEGVSEGRGGSVIVSSKEKESKMFNSSMLQSNHRSSETSFQQHPQLLAA